MGRKHSFDMLNISFLVLNDKKDSIVNIFLSHHISLGLGLVYIIHIVWCVLCILNFLLFIFSVFCHSGQESSLKSNLVNRPSTEPVRSGRENLPPKELSGVQLNFRVRERQTRAQPFH